MTIFFFPGQGSQYPGMARDFFDQLPPVRDLFDLASETCGQDMKTLLFEGSDDDLKATKNAQPAVLLASLAAREGLRAAGFESDGCAGHSLGEYAALADAGVLTAEDCFKAVAARSRLMADAGEQIRAEKGDIGMAAVIGLGPDAVRRAVDGLDDVWSANENSPVQTAIGGTKAAMDAAAPALKAAGARRIIPLKVSCPFHTPLMAGPAEAMKSVLAGLNFQDPVKTLWSDVTASVVRSADESRRLMVQQITHPVRWVDLMASVAAQGPGLICESGPGTVLTGLWSKSGHSGNCFPAGKAGDLEKIG